MADYVVPNVSATVVSGITIFEEDTLAVYGSGSALDIELDGGRMTVSGGYASGGSAFNYASQHILSGGEISGASVSDNAYQYVSGGLAVSTMIEDNGAQQVSDEGIAVDTQMLWAYGRQNVVSGGSAVGTLVSARTAVQYVEDGGSVQNTVILAGSQAVMSGGAASGTSVRAGSVDVSLGGLLLDAVANPNGKIKIYNGGSAVGGFVYIGASQVISSGGAARNIVVSGGSQIIMTGGVAYDTLVLQSIVDVSGGALYNVTVNSPGKVVVRSGGVVSGGVAYSDVAVYSGAMAYDIDVYKYQTLMLGGVAGNITVMSGGQQDVSGSAYHTRVSSGGSMSLLDLAAIAVDTTVESGGVLLLNSGALNGVTTIELGGEMRLADSVISGGEKIVLDLSRATAAGGEAPCISDLSLLDISGTELVVSCAVDPVDVKLAGGAAAFDGVLNVNFTDNNRGAVTTSVGYINYFSDVSAQADVVSGALQLTLSASAEELPTVASVTTVEVNAVDRGAIWNAGVENYTGKIVACSGGVGSGSLYLDVSAGDASVKLYAGSLNGTANIEFTGGAAAVLGGAENASGSVGAVNLVIGSGASATVVGGAGAGNVVGDVSVEIASGVRITNRVYGGAILGSTESISTVIGGNIELVVSGGSFGSDVIGGSRVNGNGGTSSTIDGNIAITVEGGDFLSSNSVYGGGFAVGCDMVNAGGDLLVSGDVTIDWSDGVMSGAISGGRGIFGGALASDNAVAKVAGNVAITVDSGVVTNIYGGGWAQNGGDSTVSGNVNISVSGGDVSNIYGGGAHASDSVGLTAVGGNVNILVSGGSIGRIYARGQVAGDTVAGEATVTFSGANDYSTLVSGAGYGGANADEGVSKLVLSGYSGNFYGTIGQFDAICFEAGATADLTGAEVVNTNWDFDLSGQSASETVLTWSDADAESFVSADIDLWVDSGNAQNWTLAVCDPAASNVFGGTSFELYIDGSDEAVALQLGVAVSGTGTVFDGYMLSETNGMLGFALVG